MDKTVLRTGVPWQALVHCGRAAHGPTRVGLRTVDTLWPRLKEDPQVSARPSPLIGPLIVGLALLAALSGCGTGQISQTARHQAGVNGAGGQAGPLMIRDAVFPFPSDEQHFYPRGSSVPLQLTVVNTAGTPDRLAAVQSSVAGSVQLSGQTTIPGRAVVRAVAHEVPEPGEQPTTSGPASTTTAPTPTTGPPASTTTPGQPSSTTAPPTSPPTPAPPTTSSAAPTTTSTSAPTSTPELAQGELLILLVDLTEDIRPGRTVRVVLVFERAGEVMLQVPVAAPEEPRGESAH